jgi:hypothetical protein
MQTNITTSKASYQVPMTSCVSGAHISVAWRGCQGISARMSGNHKNIVGKWAGPGRRGWAPGAGVLEAPMASWSAGLADAPLGRHPPRVSPGGGTHRREHRGGGLRRPPAHETCRDRSKGCGASRGRHQSLTPLYTKIQAGIFLITCCCTSCPETLFIIRSNPIFANRQPPTIPAVRGNHADQIVEPRAPVQELCKQAPDGRRRPSEEV